MPLGQFISEVMDIVRTQPDVTEILVKRVHPLRFAAGEGAEKYAAVFEEMNARVSAARAKEF